MKPRIRERPIQAWGVRVEWSVDGWSVDLWSLGLSSSLSVWVIETSPSAVGVLGGSSLPESGSVSSVTTSPGIASISLVSGLSSSSRFCSHCGFCRRLYVWYSGACLFWNGSTCGDQSLRLCACLGSLALYKVSTPSGMMTIKAVPTRTPIPMVEMRRSRDWDKENDSGSDPARKDLFCNQSLNLALHWGLTQWPSRCSR